MNLLARSFRLPASALRAQKLAGQRALFSTTQSSEVLAEDVNGKKILTLNRPKALNALNISMVKELYNQLKVVNDEKSSDIVILKGAGEKAFCAGGDVLAVTKSFKDGTSFHKDFFEEEYRVNKLIRYLPVPFVSLINGITMGGGCGVSVNGRYQMATEQTMLAMPETALGLFPDVGATYFLSRLKNELGLFLALTGYRLRGADVFHAGLASHYTPSKVLPELVDALVKLPKSECTFEGVDATLKKFTPATIPAFTLEPYLKDIASCFHADTLEEVFAKLGRLNTDFARKQLEELRKMSPTSLKVTFRQIRTGASLSYPEVIPVETRLAQRFLQEHDFHEGCRAILIDKDRNPKWNPSKIEDVTDEKVDWYFANY